MDINKFFGLFNGDKEEERLRENLNTFKDTPVFKIGMFKKLIMNGLSFKKSVVNFFNSSNDPIDVKEIDLMGEFMMYHRGWFWIEQIDINDEYHLKDLENTSDDDLLVALKLSIHYFESEEEFEKCAHLKKIQNLVEKNLEI